MCSNLPDWDYDGALASLILPPANQPFYILTGGHHPEGRSGSRELHSPFTYNPIFKSRVQDAKELSPTRRLPVWVVLSPACLMTGSAVADTAMAGVLALAASTPEGLGRFWNSVRWLMAVRLVSRSAEANQLDATR